MILTPQQFAESVRDAGDKAARAMSLAIKDATREAHRESIQNAPRSPSQKQATAAQKVRYTQKHGSAKGWSAHMAKGRARRNPNSHSRPAPGGLERSIRWEMTGSNEPDGMVYVASNAPAGKYAARIHDEKGKTWKKRGIGTLRKGARADHRYIKRAIDKVVADFQARFAKIFKALGE